MSGLPPVQGHRDARDALARAVRRRRLPGSILIHGATGIGRQRIGLWLGQLLLCERPGEDPCGVCRSCRLVRRLEHPDLHWFFPLPRPRAASSPEKLLEALEDARAAELQARREAPLRQTVPGEPIGLYLAQVHALRRLATTRPSMGSRQIFLIGDAELLVPQESSPEAANALLKLLEEPPDGAVFVLTATEPDALLPTIRSRLLPVRLSPLSPAEVSGFLVEQAGVDPAAADHAARLAQGSIGRALAFLPQDGEEGPLETLRRQAFQLLSAALAEGAVPRLAAAHAESPAGARGSFRDGLDFLALWCRDLAAVAEGSEAEVVNTDAIESLRRLAGRYPAAGAGAPEAIALIEEARSLASGNVNPQLTLAWLLRGIAAALAARPLEARAP